MKYLVSVLILFPLLYSCNKQEEGQDSSVITTSHNLYISSATRAIDSVSIDIDQDGRKDIRLMATNNQFTITLQPAIVKLIQLERLNTDIELTHNLQYANSGFYRLYNFGSSSLFLLFAKGFTSGQSIDSLKSFSSAQYYCTSASIYNNVPGFQYNEMIGDFNGAEKYIGVRINKPDGKHYGAIKIRNSNNCMDAALLVSSYNQTKGIAVILE